MVKEMMNQEELACPGKYLDRMRSAVGNPQLDIGSPEDGRNLLVTLPILKKSRSSTAGFDLITAISGRTMNSEK